VERSFQVLKGKEMRKAKREIPDAFFIPKELNRGCSRPFRKDLRGKLALRGSWERPVIQNNTSKEKQETAPDRKIQQEGGRETQKDLRKTRPQQRY